MIAKLVVIWILGGAFVALLILNSLFSSGSSAGSQPDDNRANRPGPH